MTPDPTDFRGCYYHPRKPAIKECINCERPICKRCEEESGDPLLCKKCKEELEALERTPFDKMLRQGNVVSSKRQAPSIVGEVTITADGKIEAPEPPAPAPAEPEEPEPEPDVEPERAATRVKRRIPRTPETGRPAARKSAPVPLAAKPAAVPAEQLREEEEEEAPAEDVVEVESYRERVARKRLERRARPPRDMTGPGYQMLHGLGYGVGVAIVVSALWLLFAFATKQWTQVSVLSLGLLVPWIIYKGTTTRNRRGVKVWSEPPAPMWISVPSLIIVAAVAPPLQLLAFKVIYGSNPHLLPFSDFMDRFFTNVNWFLAILGLLAAILVPFVLARGQHWRKPSLRRSRKAVEDEDEADAEDEPEPEAENS